MGCMGRSHCDYSAPNLYVKRPSRLFQITFFLLFSLPPVVDSRVVRGLGCLADKPLSAVGAAPWPLRPLSRTCPNPFPFRPIAFS